METISLVVGVLSGGALGAVVVALWYRARLAADAVHRSRIPELERLLAAEQERSSGLAAQLGTEREATAQLRERVEREREAGAEKLALLENAERKLADSFKALSSDALSTNSKLFLEMARAALGEQQERTKTDLDTRSQAIDTLVQPLRESLEKVDVRIAELEKVRAHAYGELSEQVRALAQGNMQLQLETANLVKALRTPQVRGRWGEIQLKRVVELAGMLEYCDFSEQASVTTSDGRLRPDMVVRLPGGRNVVVDSKAPLQAYLEALECKDDAARTACMAQHAQQIRTHMKKLSEKAYWEQFHPTPEFVVLFIPGESFYSAALEQDPSLIESAAQQRVVLATPTTLIALLKAIAYGWRQELVAKEAQQISQLGRDLYMRVRTLAQHFDDMRRSLDRTVGTFNKAVRSLETRVLPSARRFRELGVAGVEDIPALEVVEQAPRQLQSTDLTVVLDGDQPLVAALPRVVQTEL